jgi:DNA polymerase I-like protein with 3'-5' exonuclease and polymerase domains/uracil-DNA glycosylase
MVIGMSPGREELKADKPFVGKSGTMLWTALSLEGIDRSDCYILNVIGEFPDGKQGKITPVQQDKWWEAFDKAARAFTGHVVLCLGGDALSRYTGLVGIENWRGYLIQPAEFQRPCRIHHESGVYKSGKKKGQPKEVKRKEFCYPPCNEGQRYVTVATIHPAAVMRTGFATLPAFEADVRRAARLAGGAEPEQVCNAFTETPFLNEMTGALAFDIETEMTNIVTRIGMAYDRSLVSDDIQVWSARWDHDARAHTKIMLEMEGVTKFAHNLAYDYPRLRKTGIDIKGPLFDTMLAANLLQPDLYKGLNAVASMYLDTQRWKHLSDAEPARYNALDAARTLEIGLKLRKDIEIQGMKPLFEGTIMPTIPVLIDMSERGVRIDMPRRAEWTQRLAQDGMKLLMEWNGRHGDIDPESPYQLRKLLYDDMGLPIKFTKYGVITTDAEAIQELMNVDLPADAPERRTLELILEMRRVNKDMATYAGAGVGEDGCIHPSFLPAGKDDDSFGRGIAGTGRITAKNPNAQQQHKEARKLYIPHEEGMVLGALDFNQIEPRILAALANDDVLQQAIDNGLHAYNMDRLKVDKTRAKVAFFTWSYGGGAPTLRRQLLAHGYMIPQTECQQLLDYFDKAFVKAARLRAHIIRRAGEGDRSVTNPFKRKRYFYDRKKRQTAAINTLIQGTAADVMWGVLRGVDKAVSEFGGALLLTVHDEVLVELPTVSLREGAAAVREEMEREWPQIRPGFKCPTALKVGKNWGEMEEVPWK